MPRKKRQNGTLRIPRSLAGLAHPGRRDADINQEFLIQPRTVQNAILRAVVSPGSYFGKANSQPVRMPTGERTKSTAFVYQMEIPFEPDTNSEIILVTTPFIEAPLIRIVRAPATGPDAIASATAYQYENLGNDDALKSLKVYAWRLNAQSATLRYTGNVVNAQGAITAATIPPSHDNKVYVTDNGGIDSYARTLDHVPVTDSTLTSIARARYTGDAQHGAYLVNRHFDATLPFTYRNSDQNKATSGIWNTSGTVTYKTNALYFSTDAQAGVPVKNSSGQLVGTTAASCMDLGIIIVTGLQPGASFKLKMYSAVEYIQKPKSGNETFSAPIPARDYRFLSALSRAENVANFGPEEANDWGSFFKGLNKVWDVATPIIDAVASSAPGPVGAVAQTISSVNKQLREIKNQVAQQKKAKPVEQIVYQPVPAQVVAQPQPTYAPTIIPTQPVSAPPQTRARTRRLW